MDILICLTATTLLSACSNEAAGTESSLDLSYQPNDQLQDWSPEPILTDMDLAKMEIAKSFQAERSVKDKLRDMLPKRTWRQAGRYERTIFLDDDGEFKWDWRFD